MKTVSGLLEDVILAMDEAAPKVTPHDPSSYVHANSATLKLGPSCELCCSVPESRGRYRWMLSISRVGDRTVMVEEGRGMC